MTIHPTPLTAAQTERARELQTLGLTFAGIARWMELDRHAVSRALQDA